MFEPKSIDIAGETAKLTGLLERSRDLRLLVLWGQFECLAARPNSLAEVIEAIADTLDAFGDEVHPQSNTDMKARREAIMELAQPIAIVTGLRHMGLVGSGTVTLRLLQVADGRFSAHSGEGDVSGEALRGALSGAENAKAVDATFTALVRITVALGRIIAACQAGATPFSPNLTSTLTILNEMREEIMSARPDLRGKDAEAPKIEAPSDASPSRSVSATAAPRGETTLKSHAEARQALIACEVYFERNEPSSASLVVGSPSPPSDRSAPCCCP